MLVAVGNQALITAVELAKREESAFTTNTYYTHTGSLEKHA